MRRPPAGAAKSAEPTKPANADFVGLKEADLEKFFGQPSERRDEAPGKYLSYRRKGCRLDLSLYPDVETRTFRTVSYEVTSDDHTDQGKLTCRSSFGALLGAR